MKIPIVNEQDEIIEYKDRNDVTNEDIIRITNIWITDNEGNILLAQRSFNKKNSPGKWSSAVAGTVEEGETYESNAYKELEEEIGVTGFILKPIKKIFYTSRTGKKFSYFFGLQIPKETELKIQKQEVEKVKWFSKEEFRKNLLEKPDDFVHSFTVQKEFTLSL